MTQARSSGDGRQDRGEATRRKLLDTAVLEFGRLGFDGVSTRALAKAAGVNLQAIAYHFGDKQGLYLAAVGDIRDRIRAHVGDLPLRIGARLQAADAGGPPLEKAEARAFLTEIGETMLRLFVSAESDPWAQLVLREQAAPTAAFDLLYQGIMGPMLGTAERLLAILRDEPPGSEHLRLRLLSLVGSLLVFRTARATLKAQLGWTGIDAAQAAAIVALVPELIAGLERAPAQ